MASLTKALAQRVRPLLYPVLPDYPREVLSRMEGVFPRECCVCGFKGLFKGFGHPPRYDALCPNCGSLERHRLLVLCLREYPNAIRSSARLLHFAPEEAVKRLIEKRVASYKSADIQPGKADLVLNIEHLDVPDGSFDAIICFDVLEHVDDRKALAEMFRVLSREGTALLRTPFISNWPTYENPAVKSPEDRLLHFGQEDHVRYFGGDVRDLIRSAGFSLADFVAMEPDVSRHGLLRGETIFVASKID